MPSLSSLFRRALNVGDTSSQQQTSSPPTASTSQRRGSNASGHSNSHFSMKRQQHVRPTPPATPTASESHPQQSRRSEDHGERKSTFGRSFRFGSRSRERRSSPSPHRQPFSPSQLSQPEPPVAQSQISQSIPSPPNSLPSSPTNQSPPPPISPQPSVTAQSPPTLNIREPLPPIEEKKKVRGEAPPLPAKIKYSDPEELAKKYLEYAERLLFGRKGEEYNEKKAVKYLKKAAFKNGGHAEAQAVLGFCYEFGLGVAQDFKSAENLYICGAIKGIGLAQSRLAFLRRYGRPTVKIDRVEAEEWFKRCNEVGASCISWLRRAADDDRHPAANYCVGVCYHDGIGVQQNADRAVAYYVRALEAGTRQGDEDDEGKGFKVVPDVYCILGFCYGEGFGVPKDTGRAFDLYVQAAAYHESVSMYNVAHCYEEGIGVERDYDQAVEWYQRSAELGNCYAQNSLGYMYEEGLGVERDEAKAAQWYTLSAEQGYPWAQCNLGFCYQNGIGVPKNEELGSYWYQMAAVQGHSRAQHNLGHAYQYGIGVPKDETFAVEWYRQSSSAGNAFAMHSLGYCYQYGIGTAIDEPMAVEMYRRSAELGHAPAQLSLGCCYRSGVGTEPDLVQAFKYVRLAAVAGNDLAQNTLGHFYEEGVGVAKNVMRAEKWYRAAAEQGNVWALTNLAVLYGEGGSSTAGSEDEDRGVARRRDEAMAMLTEAAGRGSLEAQVRIGEMLVREGREFERAVVHFEAAASGGSIDATFQLARCHELGIGTPVNLARALELYEYCAAAGDARSGEKIIGIVMGLGLSNGGTQGEGDWSRWLQDGWVPPAA
ncbi:hypothetical protein BJ742DRAFT_822577 [Cladochytrium replicatum]|nr:hypothetical protein BJ742DRAFT_822577 [Cladochytrium replicatum]